MSRQISDMNALTNPISVTLPATFESFSAFEIHEYPEGQDQSVVSDRPIFINFSLLESIDFSATSIKEVPEYGFYFCTSLRSVSFSDDVSSIGNEAFAYCRALTEVNINKAYIGDRAFANCTSLTSATIGELLNDLSNSVQSSQCTFMFVNCTALTSLTINDWTPRTSSTFENPYVGLCDGCTSLQTVSIPDCIDIPRNMFKNCTQLSTQFVFSNITDIGAYAFAGCNSLYIKLQGNDLVSLASTAFSGSTGKLVVKYGLKDYYENMQAIKNSNVTVEEYGVPAPPALTAYQVVAGADFHSWFSQYTTSQLQAVKRLKVTGELSTTAITDISKMCGSGSSGLSLTSLDLTEVTNTTLPAFTTATALDTLLLPRAATALGNNFFYGFKSTLVVVAPWQTPIPLTSVGTTMTLIVPRGTLYTYKNAEKWKLFGTIKPQPLEGNAQVTLVSGRADKAVELWEDGELQGSIDKKGGAVTATISGDASVAVYAPTQYLSKILFNGTDVTSLLVNATISEAAYAGYKAYFIEDFTASTVVKVTFEGVPETFSTYGLMFNIDGGPGTANVSVSYGDGTSESFDLSHDGNGSTYKALNFYSNSQGIIYAQEKDVEQVVVTAQPAADEFAMTSFGAGYRNQQQVENNEAMYEAVNNGNGTYTYTLLGKNMTSSYAYLTFPAQQQGGTKTTISVADGINVGYFFYKFDIGNGYYNVNMTDPGTYMSGTVTIAHGDDSDSYGNVFIYVPENSTNFRVIFNGEVVPFGRGSNVWLEWNGNSTTSYDEYMIEKYGYV